MTIRRLSLFGFLCLALSGCGMVLGQMMGASAGVKDFQVRQGAARDFGAVKRVLVVAPFARAEGAWTLCRGEDEALLAEGFTKEGLYEAELDLEPDRDAAAARLQALRTESPEKIRELLKLKAAPEAILSGALLSRDETVAPTVGVLHTVRLRFDLLTLATGRTSSVEIEVKALTRDLHTLIVKELRRRAAGA